MGDVYSLACQEIHVLFFSFFNGLFLFGGSVMYLFTSGGWLLEF